MDEFLTSKTAATAESLEQGVGGPVAQRNPAPGGSGGWQLAPWRFPQ